MTKTRTYPKSFYDCDGLLLIDCGECTRGYNGPAVDKCACGGFNKGGDHYCAIGTLMENVDKSKIRSLPRIIRHIGGNKSLCFNGTPCRGVDKCAGYEQCQIEPEITRRVIRNHLGDQKIEIGDTGDLEDGSTTPCPNCGEDLGYYAELVGHETECDNCHQTFEIKPVEGFTWQRIA